MHICVLFKYNSPQHRPLSNYSIPLQAVVASYYRIVHGILLDSIVFSHSTPWQDTWIACALYLLKKAESNENRLTQLLKRCVLSEDLLLTYSRRFQR